MRRDPITCAEHDSAHVAAQRMWEHDVGALPVLDDEGRVVGMVTDRDLAMAAYLDGVTLDRIAVHRAMTRGVLSVGPRSPVSEVERLMQEHQVRRIAVVDDAGRPVGMVSLDDLALRAGPARGAPVSHEELTVTMRAVCQPRAATTPGRAPP